MSNRILFVFEGAKTEKQIAYNLCKFFITEHTLICCVFGAEIYQLYNQISKDEDLDTFSLLKEKNPDPLKEYNRDDFAEIYLFFDYDGHARTACDIKMEYLLKIFDNETDKGKLYISYPMVESLKHISDFPKFKNVKVECKENIHYKKIVDTDCINELRDFTQYTLKIWKQLIDIHLKKMNYVVNNLFEFPQVIIPQQDIFLKQSEKFITKQNQISVLSAFPVFIHDYYGNEKTKLVISS